MLVTPKGLAASSRYVLVRCIEQREDAGGSDLGLARAVTATVTGSL